MALKIAINTRLLLSGRLEGIGNFTWEILKRWIQDHPKVEFHLLFEQKPSSEFLIAPNVVAHTIGPVSKVPQLAWYRLQYRIPKLLRKIKADLFIGPDSLHSTKLPCKSIYVLHDINFVHRPKDLPFYWAKYYNKWVPRFIEFSNKVVTVSEFSKKDIVQTLSTPENKIKVVYNAAKSVFKPTPEAEQIETRNKFAKGAPYFVYVGALHARKNVNRLFKAFDQYKENNNTTTKLLVVGTPLFGSKQNEEEFNQLKSKNDIIFTGRVTDEDLVKIIGAAQALTFVPLFEGFGIPVIEAFACHTPVICSNTTSLPEVEGGAAISVDPENINAIAYAMKQSHDLELRKRMVKRGLQQLEKFSWEQSAQNFWTIIENTI